MYFEIQINIYKGATVKKVFILFVVLSLLLCGCGSSGMSGPDFRNADWGMSEKQVRKTETAKESPFPDKEENRLTYLSDDIAGLSAIIYYDFVKGKLVRGYYCFVTQTMEGEIVENYEKAVGIMKKKYGEPIKDVLYWTDDTVKELYNNDEETGVLVGELSFYANWGTRTTDILAALKRDNGKIDFVVIYTSRKLKHLLKEEEKETEKKQRGRKR